MKGIITDIQRFSIHDGPGIRTTVFFKGCPLRCVWCHNPETQSPWAQPQLDKNRCVLCGACAQVCPEGCHRLDGTHVFDNTSCLRCGKCVEACEYGAMELTGREIEAGEVMDTVLRDRPFYGKEGGITLSGGEPTMQSTFAGELLSAAKNSGITTCVETCGIFLDRIELSLCDRIYFDIKSADEDEHKRLTGIGNEAILRNLRSAAAVAADRIIIRFVAAAGLTDNDDHAAGIRRLADENGIKRVEPLAFHPYGSSKAESIGDREARPGKEYVPSDEAMARIKKICGES